MKLAKRMLALAMFAVMLISCCVFQTAATVSVSMTKTDGHNITSGGEVVWSEYNVYGSKTGHTEKTDILQFNPKDGYMPMVFTNCAGYCSRLPTHFSDAQNRYGYEVAGLINGSFFSTTDGTLVGMVISNGRIVCGHNAYSDDVVAFTPDGKMHVVDTKIEYEMTINGQRITNAIRYINKRFDVDAWTVSQFYYYDTSCGNVADSGETGYEIICEKVNNSDLMVGGTLYAKVIEVKKDAGPSTFESNESIESNRFVLYCRSTSTYVPMVKNLKAGDDITITATETVAASKQIMETANSVITNVGWLVKNGVDQTDIYSSIGDLSVDAYYRSTVFGTKPDGTYVFLVSDGASTGNSSRSLSPREIAATMIKLGCNNVIRMDGGGSAAMYSTNCDGKGTDGYHNYYSDGGYIRPVADSILIVKKTSAQDANINADLKAAIADAKKYVATTPNATLSKYIAEAEAAFASGAVVESDARRFYAKISALLEEAPADTSKTILSKGKSYTTTAPNRGDGWDDNKVKLTDGSKSNKNARDAGLYTGWTAATKTVDVTVDLGSVTNSNTYTVYGASNFWGIKPINKVKVSVSTNGTTFTEVGSSTTLQSVGEGYAVENGDGTSSTIKLSSITIETDTIQSARYIRFTISSPGYIWLDEVEVVMNSEISSTTSGKRGDVNNDGKIDQYDYILVKRHYFKTRILSDSEMTSADANKDGKVDQYDYILIARHYFGTFVIK